MITGALIKLCADRKLFSLDNVKWLKMLFFLALLTGGFVGAVCKRHAYDAALGLWLIAGVKTCVGLSFFLNPRVDEERGDNEGEGNEEQNSEARGRMDLEKGKREE